MPTRSRKHALTRAPERGAVRVASDSAMPFRPASAPLDGALAWTAFAVNEALGGQVSLAHAIGRINRSQAEAVASAQPLLPAGPLRDAAAMAARMQEGVAEAIFEAANRWGRAFGHLAFAFPVGARPW